jgi:hypothetical protein
MLVGACGVVKLPAAERLVSRSRNHVNDPARTAGPWQGVRTPLYPAVQQGRATQP